MKKLLVTLCVGILICSSVSATIGTSASTTFTAGTTSVASTPSFSYDCHAASADNDTVIFNAYQLYNSSVTYAYSSGSPGNSSGDYIPYVYNLAKHTSLSSSKQGIYATGNNNPTYLNVRSGRYIIIKVTNVTGVIISGNSGGNSRYVELSAYTDLDSDPVKTTATLGNTNGTEAISGLTAGTTYFIKIAGTADNNSKVYEIGLIYPHAGAIPACTAPALSAPASATVYDDQEKSATKALAVTVSNSGAMTSLSYQWYSDTNADATGGTALTSSGEIDKGSQEATYSSTTSREFSTSLYYYCVVTNTCGVDNVASTTSYPFTVTTKDCVSPGLSISLKP